MHIGGSYLTLSGKKWLEIIQTPSLCTVARLSLSTHTPPTPPHTQEKKIPKYAAALLKLYKDAISCQAHQPERQYVITHFTGNMIRWNMRTKGRFVSLITLAVFIDCMILHFGGDQPWRSPTVLPLFIQKNQI